MEAPSEDPVEGVAGVEKCAIGLHFAQEKRNKYDLEFP